MSFRDQLIASKAIGAKNFDTAIDAYKRILDKNKDNYQATAMLAFCYEWKGDIAQAIIYSDKFLSRFPNDFQMLLLSARYWAQSRDGERAYSFVCRALENANEETHEIPRWPFKLLKPLSIFFKRLRGLEEKADRGEQINQKYREDQLNWAKQYKAWYESKQSTESTK